MKKKLAMLLAATMLVMLFTGCGAGGKEDKGELNLYTWDGMFPQEILDGFEKETGIRINYSNFDYDEDMLAKLEETKGGDYDLVIADDYIIELAIQEGLVQKLDTSRISSYDNLNPVFMSQFYDPQNEYTVPYGAGIPLIVYDPGLTDVKITGYEDLWNPELENNVALTANYRVIDGITLKTMGESFNTEDLDVIRAAGDKLLTLAPNIRVINDNNTQDYLISGGSRSGISVHFPGVHGTAGQTGPGGSISEGRSRIRYHGRVCSCEGTQCRCGICIFRLYQPTGKCGKML